MTDTKDFIEKASKAANPWNRANMEFLQKTVGKFADSNGEALVGDNLVFIGRLVLGSEKILTLLTGGRDIEKLRAGKKVALASMAEIAWLYNDEDDVSLWDCAALLTEPKDLAELINAADPDIPLVTLKSLAKKVVMS